MGASYPATVPQSSVHLRPTGILRLSEVLSQARSPRYPATVPKEWHAPRWWLGHPSRSGQPATGAWCIHEHEGAWNANTGNGYFGGFQFLLRTWRGVGGVVRPDTAAPREQLYRVWLVWLRDGHSWREWGTARGCGLGDEHMYTSHDGDLPEHWQDEAALLKDSDA